MSTYTNDFMPSSTSSSHDASSIASCDSIMDEKPAFRTITRPPQFVVGKTATALDEMNKMILWYMEHGKELEISHMKRKNGKNYKEIIHLIFVNNNLIEGDQWNNRILQRKSQTHEKVINSIIFSSKSQISTADALYKVVSEGEYDHINVYKWCSLT
jgi:hypothetical protein